MVRLIFPIAALAALFAPAHAIVGGEHGDGARAHTVMIISPGGEICSGTAIAHDLVITAAHCVVRPDRYSVSVSNRTIAVARIVSHPRFRRDSFETRRPSPDLAILKLASLLPGDIRAAVLSESAALPRPATRFLIAGWGVASEGERKSVGTLRAAQLSVVGTTGGIMVRLSAGAGAAPRGSCDGDSGGSVYREEGGQLVLHGVIGWATGPKGRGCGAVTGATLIGIQIGWIRETAQMLGSPLGE